MEQTAQSTERESTPDPVPPAAQRCSWRPWLRDASRMALLRPVALKRPTLAQGLALALLALLVDLALDRLAVPGPAVFDFRGWWSGWATTALVVVTLALCAAPPRDAVLLRLPAWLVLWWLASLVPMGLHVALAHASEHGMPAAQLHALGAGPVAQAWLLWAVGWLPFLWWVAITTRSAQALGLAGRRLLAFAAAVLLLVGVVVDGNQERAWYPDPDAGHWGRGALLSLDQELFEQQQAAAQQRLESIARQRPDRVEVYGLVYAPYAAEDVFLREARLVESVLGERFDAVGRVLALVNHADTVRELPWATPLNLERALHALARRMDRAQDVLVLYLTSHGGQDFQLASHHGVLAVAPLSPQRLKAMLDAAGIRHRVLIISACYSGGWIAPLADEHTLVMTAASADKTSYGCGHRSELTYFGRALFAEQLRHTHSFEDAFARAVPVIAERERQARKPDGFSDPQIHIGPAIRPVLDELQRTLAAPAPTPAQTTTRD